MITKNLLEEILVTPASAGADKLYIVSGYASATMAAKHFEELITLKQCPQVNLIIGMFPRIGNLQSNHVAFQTLCSEEYPTIFNCRYLIKPPPVHVKAYGWFKGEEAYCGFIGSANYTKNAFSNSMREAMAVGDAEMILKYYNALLDETIDCREEEANRLVKEAIEQYREAKSSANFVEPASPALDDRYAGLEHVSISFLSKQGTLPKGSGLNWGFRPNNAYNRDKNQAYIRVPSVIYNTEFFPPVAQPFTVLTDDDRSLICSRAQQSGKAIHSPLSNTQIGLYFRNRLGLASGAFIKLGDLLRYGRTSVEFYKIDDETYLMDFSAPSSAVDG